MEEWVQEDGGEEWSSWVGEEGIVGEVEGAELGVGSMKSISAFVIELEPHGDQEELSRARQ